MRVLILWARLNGERVTVASALADQLAKMNIACEIADVVSLFSGRETSARLSAAYAKACASPNGGNRALLSTCKKGCDVLQVQLEQGGFDIVISTHTVAALTMSWVRTEYKSAIPHYFVSVDYARAPGLAEIKANGYFVPHGMLHGEYIRCMIRADQLLASGIPLTEDFYRSADREQAKQQLGTRAGDKLVLINCSGDLRRRDCKRIPKLITRLPDNAQAVILLGRNEKLRAKLEGLGLQNLRMVGEEADVALYLSAADVFLTPAVGVTAAEAMAKKVPMLFYGSRRGLERRTAVFLSERGVAKVVGSREKARAEILSCLNHPETLQPQIEAMESITPPIAAEQICRSIVKREHHS